MNTSVEFKTVELCKLPKNHKDYIELKKKVNNYLNEIDNIMIDLLKEHIFTNGISDEIDEKMKIIMKEGKKNK